jgi:HK97 family phage prohead protease
MDKDVQGFASLVTSEKTIRHAGPQAKECEGAFRVKSIDVQKRQIRVLASSADLDRDKERILPTAFKERLSIYQSNPVVIAAHSHRLSDGKPSVIGRAVSVWVDKESLWAVIEFAQTELAEQYWQLYRDGYMKAVSIGFIPLEWMDEKDEKLGYIRTHTKVELLEISCVSVPSNPQALTRSQQRKLNFVNSKRAEGEEKAILDAIRAEDPGFDAKAEEFAYELLCSDKYAIDEEDEPEQDYVELVTGIKENEFVALVKR